MYLFSKKNEKRGVEINFTPDGKVKAPVKKGDIVGRLSVYENGIEIGSVSVISNEDVAEKTYFDVVRDVVRNWPLVS